MSWLSPGKGQLLEVKQADRESLSPESLLRVGGQKSEGSAFTAITGGRHTAGH